MEQLTATAAIPRPAVTSPAVSAKWLALLATSLGIFMASLDATIVNVAFPEIGRSFPEATRATLSWVLNGYTIAFGALLIVSGRLADRYGRKRVFFTGLGVFTGASALCGLAPSEGTLIAARVVQGVGAAMMLPSSLALLLAAWPAEQRATAVGMWGAVSAIAAATGPSLGALIVDGPGWRWAFLVNIPIGLGAWWLGSRVLTDSRDEKATGRLDFAGVMLISVAMGLLALAIVQGRDWGWGSVETIAAFAAAGAAVVAFVAVEARHPSPVVDLALFRVRSFAVANLAMFSFGVEFFAMLLGSVLFLTTAWDYSTLRAGLAITPTPLLAALVAGPAGKYAGRHGYRRILVPGSFLAAMGTAWVVVFADGSPDYLAEWLPGALVLGVGIGMSFAHLSGAAVASLPAARFAVGSAVNQTARTVGSMVGVALLVAVFGSPATMAETLDGFDRVFLLATAAFAASGALALLLSPKRG